MIPVLTFSIIAAGLVFLAGKKDAARDPKLTVLLLILLTASPLLFGIMPKIVVLPAVVDTANASRFPWREILSGIWLVGFLVALSRLVFASWTLSRWRHRSILVDFMAGVEIRELQCLRGPVAAGVFRPVIFVPATWRHWTVECRQAVLEHELAHHRRRDPLSRWFVELACAVHWYHPLVRWMARRFVLQCEFACDAVVLGKGVSAKNYASVLCDVAEKRSISPLALSMAEKSSLEARVSRMLMPETGFSGKAVFVLGGLGLIAVCSLSVIGQQSGTSTRVPAQEVELRLTADPFPGEHWAP